ncbi:uncharacterized protein LOC119744627 isoform X2 [Patiria miniata]|uniref:Uncharacterized protein n=1 Tax=Patiria miniata TaxID=46514 RepID=A0A914BKF7_PATMI|nr:uncharacterized protein LOC119744627 isoform X2 [Patiria miniata]
MAESPSLSLEHASDERQPIPEGSLHPQSDQTARAAIGELKNNDRTLHSADLKDGSVSSAGNEKHLQHTVKAIGQGMKTACLQWEQLMLESEQFELFCPTRVDKLLQEAKAMEAHLLHQKEQLINRLRKLSQTLQVVP